MHQSAISAIMSRAGLAAAAITLAAVSTADAGVSIEFTGMNLVYDGSSIYDAGSASGGLADPADADPLVSVDFFDNGAFVGSLSSDISIDLFIPDITGIPAAPNSVYNTTTPGNPGFIDLLVGTSPLASEFLLVDLGSVSVTYVDISGQVQFVFGGAISTAIAQNLPFGLVADEPVSISFSTQLAPGTVTSQNGFLTGFEAFGTGEYQSIPTPSTALLIGASGIAFTGRRRRRRTV